MLWAATVSKSGEVGLQNKTMRIVHSEAWCLYLEFRSFSPQDLEAGRATREQARMAWATPAGGADNTMDEASSDKVAAIEWSIALTSRLLIKHRSGLHLRRPQVERRLRRILALWLHPALSVSFAWLRRCARQLRRATLSGGPQVPCARPLIASTQPGA